MAIYTLKQQYNLLKVLTEIFHKQVCQLRHMNIKTWHIK
jgi:hypothetical protein